MADDVGVIGWIHVAEKHALELDPFAEILALVVDEQARSRGVGATLVARAETWAAERALGLIRVRANVVRERAHRFYVRLGYSELKRQIAFAKTLGPK